MFLEPTLPALALSALLGLLGPLAAHAQAPPAPGVSEGAASAAGAGRFSLSPVPGGALRLDTATGAVSFCRAEPGRGDADGFACRLVPSERDALSAEIDRLSAENKRLRDGLAAPPPRIRDALPSEEEVDRALGLMERAMRRFLGVLKEDAPPPGRPL